MDTTASKRKMGLVPRVTIDPRRLLLRNFLTPDAPSYSVAQDWGSNIPNPGVKGNDIWGNCVPVSPAQLTQAQEFSITGTFRDIQTDEVNAVYTELTGFNKDDPSTDNGAYLLDLMKLWKRKPLYGATCLAYVEVDLANDDEVAFAVSAFGGILCAFGLPTFSRIQEVWDVPAEGFPFGQGAWTWGGHAVAVPAVSPGREHCITWGDKQGFTPKWRRVCGAEAYAPITDIWLNSGRAPSGLDLAGLLRAAEHVRTT